MWRTARSTAEGWSASGRQRPSLRWFLLMTSLGRKPRRTQRSLLAKVNNVLRTRGRSLLYHWVPILPLVTAPLHAGLGPT